MLECMQRSRGLYALIEMPRRRRLLRLTPRVRTAPEDYCAVLVRRVAQHLVQLYSKTVQVANVEWAEVAMEGVV